MVQNTFGILSPYLEILKWRPQLSAGLGEVVSGKLSGLRHSGEEVKQSEGFARCRNLALLGQRGLSQEYFQYLGSQFQILRP